MRIGIDARLPYYRTGGISTYIVNLIQQLESHPARAAHTFMVLQSRKMKSRLSQPFRCIPMWTPCHHRIEREALALEVSRLGLDVLHVTDFIPPRFGARRYVANIYDLTFLHYPEYLTAESQRYYNDQIQQASAQAHHILTISEASRQDIINLLGVAPDKVTVHLLAASEIFRQQPREVIAGLRARLGLPVDYFLFVGTFEPRKNIQGILHAYHQLRDQLGTRTPALVLVGNHGWLFEETLQLAQELNLTSALHWVHNLPNADLPALYSGAVALLMPSFYEGFGLPALEAMQCGTATIVSDRSSLPEVVGEVGWRVDPYSVESLAEAMYHAYTDEALRHQAQQAGLLRAQQFKWATVAETAMRTYQMVMEKS
ncbi:MAG: glycosyltransferase family 4 protein [Phototrophicaceae bacterium]